MACSGFICPVTQQPVTFEECLACAECGGLAGCHLSYPLLKGIARAQQPRNLGAELETVSGWQMPTLSVTELLGCPWQWQLQRDVDYYVKPEQAWWAFRGTLAHEIVARHAPPGALVEQRFFYARGGLQLTGQPDLVHHAVVYDYKSCQHLPQPVKTWACPQCGQVLHQTRPGVPALRKGSQVACPSCQRTYKVGTDLQALESPPVARDVHVQQVNLYAWLLAQHNLPVTAGELVYLDMQATVRIPLTLWPLEETEAFLDARIAAFQTGAPSCADADAAWRCDYCAVREHCTAWAECQATLAALADAPVAEAA